MYIHETHEAGNNVYYEMTHSLLCRLVFEVQCGAVPVYSNVATVSLNGSIITGNSAAIAEPANTVFITSTP